MNKNARVQNDAYYITSINDIGAQHDIVAMNHLCTFLCRQGNAEISFMNKTYSIAGGSLIFMFPNSFLTITRCSADFEGVLIKAGPELLFPILGKTNIRFRIALRERFHFTLQPHQYRRLMTLAEMIEEKEPTAVHDEQNELASLVQSSLVAAYFTEAFSDAVSQIKSLGELKESTANNLFNNFMVSMMKNITTQRTVAFYAAQANLSPNHFSAMIKSATGQSAMQWIKTVTITLAKHYLNNTDMSIKEISELMNFPDQSTFGKYFKDNCGISPANYKNKSLSRSDAARKRRQ